MAALGDEKLLSPVICNHKFLADTSKTWYEILLRGLSKNNGSTTPHDASWEISEMKGDIIRKFGAPQFHVRMNF
jgi:hypothetical protein